MRIRSSPLNILISIILAMLLQVIVLPEILHYFRPQWLLLVLAYWSLESDRKVSIFIIWFLGILLDLLNGSLLGEHALSLVLSLYLWAKLERKMSMFSIWQQSLAVLVLNLIYLGLIYVIESLFSVAPGGFIYWISALSSTVLWILVSSVLKIQQRQFEML